MILNHFALHKKYTCKCLSKEDLANYSKLCCDLFYQLLHEFAMVTVLAATVSTRKRAALVNKQYKELSSSRVPDLEWLVESLQKLGGTDTCSGIHRQLQVTYLFVNLLHKTNDEIDQFVLIHLLQMKVCYQKTNIVSLKAITKMLYH